MHEKSSPRIGPGGWHTLHGQPPKLPAREFATFLACVCRSHLQTFKLRSSLSISSNNEPYNLWPRTCAACNDFKVPTAMGMHLECWRRVLLVFVQTPQLTHLKPPDTTRTNSCTTLNLELASPATSLPCTCMFKSSVPDGHAPSNRAALLNKHFTLS